MKYGYFDDQTREYVIQQPDTPLPWINYLGSEKYFGIISNTAGGYSFYQDARLRRNTRYRNNNAPLDSGGRYLYSRANEAAAAGDEDYFWSPSWQLVRKGLDHYQCCHPRRSKKLLINGNGCLEFPGYFTMDPWYSTGLRGIDNRPCYS